jgi:hypothetical protein
MNDIRKIFIAYIAIKFIFKTPMMEKIGFNVSNVMDGFMSSVQKSFFRERTQLAQILVISV